MADLDPIELKIVMNSEEVFSEFKKLVEKSVEVDKSAPKIEIETKSIEEAAAHLAAVDAQNKAVAASVVAAKSKFDDFVQSMSANNAVLDERAQLTEKSTAALQRHKEIIEYLKDKTTETFDATQIAVYQHQIEEANTAINGIIESANKNVNLMNPAEIEAANKQLQDVQQLLDKISDSTISPSFASPEELDILSNEINKTDDAFQQLGAVIDFVQAKMSGMDSGTEEFKQLEADISAANDMLGRTPQLYDATGNSINQMNDALKTFQEQLAGETDPEAIKILNTNIETLENGIQQVKNAGKTGFDEFGNKIEEQKEKTVTLQTELENLVGQMAKLRMANQENSDEYEELKQKATEVRTAIVETNKEINSEVKTTSSFDKLIQLSSGITAGFTLAQGASALFGAEQENAEKVIQKVTGAMAVLQSLQEIQVQIKNRDTVATGQQTAAQAAYSLVVGTSTGALKIFRIALAATGIGLIVVLLAALIANWDKVTASIKKSFPALDNFGDKMDSMKSYIMGFLRAYLSLYETVFKTIMKLIDLDFKGALEQVKNTGKNAADSFNSGKADQDNTNLIEKNREKVKKALEDYNRETELIEKRTGKTQYERRQKAAAAEASLYDKGTKEYKEKMHDRNVVIAEKEKEQNDITKKAADKRQKEAEAAGKKAQQLAEKLAADRLKVLEKISEAENNLNNKESEGGEIAAIKKKYDAIRKEASKVGLGKPDIMRIDIAETKETSLKKYDLETKELLKNINQQKELYAAYESFKTNIAKTEFAKRNNINLEEFGSFSDMVDAEIQKLTDIQNRTDQQNDRLKKFQDMKTDSDNGTNNKYTQDLDKALQATITYQEKVDAIEKDFRDRRKLIEENTSGELRAQKLKSLEVQKQDALNIANQEAIEKTEIFRQLNDRMLQETQQELKARILALKEILKDPSLNPEQKKKVEKTLNDAEKLKGNSEAQTRINQLIEQRRLLEEAAGLMVDKTSQAYLDAKQSVELLNKEIEKSKKAQPFADTAKWAEMISSSFGDLANSIGDSNEGLADTIGTIGELAGAVADVAGGIAESIMSGNPIAAIGGIIKGISKIFSIAKAARESEKKAQEEIKKRQEEQLQAQLDYNATTRQRMINEAKINDLYKSRIDNIKTEAAAQKKALESNLKDQQNLFNKLLGMQTVVGQYTEKYGGFLGIGKKTRVVDVNSSLSALLGVGAGTQITDDLFKKLEEINAMNPLTGDAKNAYEQLKKLRDEYGSIADAQAELDRMLKDAVTGTTAQSLADSIREGLESGKKSFADFANDIEGFLRKGIMAGISAKMIEPKIQELQDALFDMMGDGILSAEERAQFQDMYMAIVNQSQEYMDIINQAGIDLTGGNSSVNSLQGAIKGMSQESADVMSGNLGGMRLAQLETNQILKSGGSAMLEKTSQMVEIQMDIEKNTKRTADNTERLHDVNDNVVKVVDGQDKYYKALQAAGIVK